MESVKYFYTPALQVRSFNLLCDGDGRVIESAPDFGGTYVKDLPRMAVCSVYDSEKQIMSFGVAVCSHKDNFCRKTAREMSYKRAKENPVHVTNIDPLDNVAAVSKLCVNQIMNSGDVSNNL
jgi:TPP-dependent 2-oxoacid decarboxylase